MQAGHKEFILMAVEITELRMMLCFFGNLSMVETYFVIMLFGTEQNICKCLCSVSSDCNGHPFG